MKKQNKKAKALQPKHLQLDKTIISSFDAKHVKGGTSTLNCRIRSGFCFKNTGHEFCV